MRNLLALLVAVLAFTACVSKRESPPIDITACVPGVWLDGDVTCATCIVSTPECSAPDCKESNALVLAADGTSRNLILRRSDSRTTFSSVGGMPAVLLGRWSLTTQGTPRLVQTFDATKQSYDTGVQCTQERLTRVGTTTSYARAAPALANAVLGANGSWTAISYR